MAFIDRDRLESLERSDELLPEVNQRVANLEAELHESQTALSGLRRTVEVQSRVEEALDAYAQDHIFIDSIEQEVTATLIAEGKAELRDNIEVGLRKRKQGEIYRELQISEGPTIKKELEGLFSTDGTYDKITKDARAELRRQTAADLLAEERKKAEAEISAPDKKAAYIAGIREEIAADPSLAKHRASYVLLMQGQWQVEAIQAAEARVEHEVLSEKDAIVAQAQDVYERSNNGDRQLKAIRKARTESISQMAVEELLEKSGDKAHLEALEERRALEARKLEEKNRAEKLALDFTNGGIDTEGVAEGVVFELLLGSIAEESVRKNSHSYDTEIVSTLDLRRKITVTSNGDGLFRVDRDSLAASKNVYAKQESLSEGALIRIGVLVSEQKGEKKVTLKPAIKAGATLQYDTDTSSPEFTNTHLPLADVRVDGVSARKYKETKENYL